MWTIAFILSRLDLIPSSALHSENRFQSNSEPNREGMHNKGRNSREILSCRLKDGNFL
jgi:hypothetical protein